jgi:hypothetical protein
MGAGAVCAVGIMCGAKGNSARVWCGYCVRVKAKTVKYNYSTIYSTVLEQYRTVRVYQWLRFGLGSFPHLITLEEAEITPGKRSDTRIKTVAFGPRPLHNRYTRTENCVRWVMAITYKHYKFSTVSLLKRLPVHNGRFASETAVRRFQKQNGHLDLEVVWKIRWNF